MLTVPRNFDEKERERKVITHKSCRNEKVAFETLFRFFAENKTAFTTLSIDDRCTSLFFDFVSSNEQNGSSLIATETAAR